MAAAGIAALLATTAACGSEDPEGKVDDKAEEAAEAAEEDGGADAPGLPDYDPPVKFAEEPVIVPSTDKAIQRHTGRVLGGFRYVYAAPIDVLPGSLTVTSVATGETMESWDVPKLGEGGELDGSVYAIDETSDGVVAVTAGVARVEGTGSQPDSDVLRASAVGAEDGSEVWSTELDITDMVDSGRASIGLIQADGQRMLLRVGNANAYSEAVVLSMEDGSFRQVDSDFKAQGLHGDVVTGQVAHEKHDDRYQAYRGEDASTGDEVWTYPYPEPLDRAEVDFGDRFIVVEVDNWAAEEEVEYAVLNVADGEVVMTWSEKAGSDCVDDMADSLVCIREEKGEKSLVSYDIASGEERWRWEDGDSRKVPDHLYAGRNGAVYIGYTVEGKTVAIDGESGDDLSGDIPFKLAEVGQGYAVSAASEVYLAEG